MSIPRVDLHKVDASPGLSRAKINIGHPQTAANESSFVYGLGSKFIWVERHKARVVGYHRGVKQTSSRSVVYKRRLDLATLAQLGRMTLLLTFHRSPNAEQNRP